MDWAGATYDVDFFKKRWFLVGRFFENDVFLTSIARPVFRKQTFFEKVDPILAPSPIHKDENDRKWIL